MNPPFATQIITEFIECLKSNLKTIGQGIILVNNMFEAAWAQLLIAICDCVCFLASRVKFYTEDNRTMQLMWGQSLFYLAQK